ncbi:MAG: glycoside hydrolase family 127 protein [Prevotella sp.]|nr:glycoside hydrolase family 127 protein [Prevotella sp.]
MYFIKRYFLSTLVCFVSLSMMAFDRLAIRGLSYRTASSTLSVQTSKGTVLLPLGGQTLFVAGTSFTPSIADTFKTLRHTPFVEKVFIYPHKAWLDNISDVSLLSAGRRTAITHYKVVSRQPLTLKGSNEWAEVMLKFVPQGNVITVEQTLVPKQAGAYSLSTPSMLVADKERPFKVVIPGYVHADRLSDDFTSAYAYEHGAPNRPVMYQDKCVTTPVSILENEQLTLGVAPGKDFPRKPFVNGVMTHHDRSVGYAYMSQDKELTPLLYYPVLGTEKARLQKGQTVHFTYHIILSKGNWYDVYTQAIYDLYRFDDMKEMRNKRSLVDRIHAIHAYMRSVGSQIFRKVESNGLIVSAQDYHGGIKGADGDAMKNADYGAMWMLAHLTADSILTREILPYVRNFKLQQQFASGPFKGAPQGQYFLWKSKRWVEEWGEQVEPIAITYYSLIDAANILLFQPDDMELKQSIRQAADALLSLQRADGSWALGIQLHDGKDVLPDLQDFRPTFYGMYVAYQVLKDDKYLKAAVRGADWFLAQAVEPCRFVGVCGDTRFAPDFATGMAVQALLDMYELTGNEAYKHAAWKTARYFTTYIYTHPTDTTLFTAADGRQESMQQYTQAGLVCEHIGVIGSANPQGPILLSSFAGMFVRLYQSTGDRLFLDLARASANGRDKFVEEKSGIASYYWTHFTKVALPYPQHAWWQVGWLMDYLMSEAELRSNGRISFPRGYIAPKVGPHKIMGFAPGYIDNVSVELTLADGTVENDNPDLEILTARGTDNGKSYYIVMNSRNLPVAMNVKLGIAKTTFQGEIAPYGIQIIEVSNL